VKLFPPGTLTCGLLDWGVEGYEVFGGHRLVIATLASY
jgi:hypothetical protein